jgi:ABC-type Zn uptake system ZnuABC Zn-binding protein ZnuA
MGIEIARRSRMHRRLATLLAALALAIASCGGGGSGGAGDDPAGDGRLLVVATTGILGDVVGEIVGEAGDVEVIIGPGVDPHDFQPSAADAALLREADLVVANGLGLEGRLDEMIETAEEDGAEVLELAGRLDPIPVGGPEDADHAEDDDHAEDADHAGEEDDHGHGDQDPHFWQDPVRMIDAVAIIAAALTELDPEATDAGWQERADEFSDRIAEVHEANEVALAAVPAERRKMVTNHDAFGYLADRYGFAIVGTVIPGGATLAEPSAADLADLVHQIEEQGVPAIFVENTDPGNLAAALSTEVGDDVGVFELYSDSLGDEGGTADTYLGLIESNARTVAAALG